MSSAPSWRSRCADWGILFWRERFVVSGGFGFSEDVPAMKNGAIGCAVEVVDGGLALEKRIFGDGMGRERTVEAGEFLA